jgi:hypothetical protein
MSVLCNAIAARILLAIVGILVGGFPVKTPPVCSATPGTVTIAVSVASDTTAPAAPAAPRTPAQPKKPPTPQKPVKITISDEGIKIGDETGQKVQIEIDAAKLAKEAKEMQKALAGLPESLAAVFGEEENSRYTVVRGSDIVQVGKSIEVADNELVNGDVVDFLSSITVDGKVMGDVAAILGNVTLGPHAVVNGQVVSILGNVTKEPGSVVRGETAVVGKRHYGRTGPGLVWSWGPPFGHGLVGAAARIAVFIVMAILMLLVLYFISNRLLRASQYMSASFGKSFGIGLLVIFPGTLFVVILTIILAITIVGIPVAVLLILSLFALYVLGYFTTALELGRFVAGKFNAETDSPYIHGMIGLFLLAILGIIAAILYLNPFFGPLRVALRVLSILINFIAISVGVGAFIASRGGSRPAAGKIAPPEPSSR